jgi:hypothetical protein
MTPKDKKNHLRMLYISKITLSLLVEGRDTTFFNTSEINNLEKEDWYKIDILRKEFNPHNIEKFRKLFWRIKSRFRRAQRFFLKETEYTKKIIDGFYDAGLVGQELELKFDILTSIWEKFKKDIRVKTLRKMLETMNIYFDSVSKVLPYMGAVKEFKDFLEVSSTD